MKNILWLYRFIFNQRPQQISIFDKFQQDFRNNQILWKFYKSLTATRTTTRTTAKSFLRTLPQYLLAFKNWVFIFGPVCIFVWRWRGKLFVRVLTKFWRPSQLSHPWPPLRINFLGAMPFFPLFFHLGHTMWNSIRSKLHKKSIS